jgi:hypothetical protein
MVKILIKDPIYHVHRSRELRSWSNAIMHSLRGSKCVLQNFKTLVELWRAGQLKNLFWSNGAIYTRTVNSMESKRLHKRVVVGLTSRTTLLGVVFTHLNLQWGATLKALKIMGYVLENQVYRHAIYSGDRSSVKTHPSHGSLYTSRCRKDELFRRTT